MKPAATARTAAALAAAGAALALSLATAPGAAAESVAGASGQTLTVDRATGLNAAGDTVTVTGTGFDLSKGIYVGVCVNNGAGMVPTPCLGGVDMAGSSGSSYWISSNPPSYGQGLAIPYTETAGTGSFTVSLSVAASDNLTDCLSAPNGCVIAARADHTRGADRSQDALVPISFGTSSGPVAESGASAAGAPSGLAKTGAAGVGLGLAGAGLAAAGAAAVVAARRSSARKNP